MTALSATGSKTVSPDTSARTLSTPCFRKREGLRAENRNLIVSDPQSPPGANALNATARLLAVAGLTLLLFCGWCLAKLGGATFDAGADLETWARRKRDA